MSLRSDTLQRHELIHQKDPGVSKLKGARACKECAGSKVRCNGTLPCERCSFKNVDCIYPSAGSPAQVMDSPSSAVSDYASTPGTSDHIPSSVLESTAFPRQLEQSLPYVGEVVPYPEQPNTNITEPWSYDSRPGIASQPPLHMSESFSAYAQNLLPQSTLSPFGGSYSGTEASFEIPHSSPFPRDRHASLDQLSTRPRLVSNMRAKTVLLDSNSPNSQLTLGSLREDPVFNRSDIRGNFHRFFTPATTYLSRRRRLSFPLSGEVIPAFQDSSYVDFNMLSERTYFSIQRSFINVCTGLTAYQPSYGSSYFPSLKTLNALVKLYLERFHSVLPILHHPTLDLDGCHWILSLAVVTIGSHMSDFEQSEEYSLCFDEFLRRAISALVCCTSLMD